MSAVNPTQTGAIPFTASLTMNVLNVNEAPVAVADTYTIPEDKVLTVSGGRRLLKNDTDPDNIPSGNHDPQFAKLVSGPSHGR